jgi:hypothetical protein
MKKIIILVVILLLCAIGVIVFFTKKNAQPIIQIEPGVVDVINSTSAVPLSQPWPVGEHLQVTLAPDSGAISLKKFLFKDGDVVLEQAWPDGTFERWWYSHKRESHYINREGVEINIGMTESAQ